MTDLQDTAREAMARGHRRSCIVYAIIFVLLLFATYPLALLPPGLFASMPYDISLPSSAILALMSIPVIFTSTLVPRRGLTIGCILFLLPLGYHYATSQTHGRETVELLGMVTIPLASAVVFRDLIRHRHRRYVEAIVFCLWALQVALGFFSWMLHMEVVGLSGNRNWMASLILCLSPWAVGFVYRALRCGRGSHTEGAASLLGIAIPRRFVHGTVSLFLVGIPTAFILFECESRAAYIAIIGCFILLIYHVVRSVLNRILLTIFLVLAVLVTTEFYWLNARDAIVDDIRLPMWGATSVMIKDNIVVGVGPGEFTRSFPPYRANSRYHYRDVAAAVTIHPHNELLNIAAQLGLAAAAAWALLLLPLFRRPSLGRRAYLFAQISAFSVVIPGMFDMTLVQPPTNLVGLLMIGACLSPMLRRRRAVPAGRILHPVVVTPALLVFAAWALLIAVADLRPDRSFRKFLITSELKQWPQALGHLETLCEVEPNNAKFHYLAASLCLEKVIDIELGLKYIDRAILLDPNFAHVNDVAGKLYGMNGKHKEALRFFRDEWLLFPRSAVALQTYFIWLSMTGNMEALTAMDSKLTEIYTETIERQARGDRQLIRQRILAWQRAIRNGRDNEAIRIAKELCGRLPRYMSDAGLAFLSQTYPALDNVSKSDFNELDVHYWRQIIALDDILVMIRARLKLDKHTRLSPDQIHQYLTEVVSLDPSPAETFAFPADVLGRSKIGVRSWISLYAWLARREGYHTLIRVEAEGRTPDVAWVLSSGRALRLDLDGADVRITEVDTAEVFGQLTGPKPFAAITMVFFPQEFFFKNQTLGALLSHFMPESSAPSAAVPSQYVWLNIAGPAQLNMSPADFEQICFPPPFQALYGNRGAAPAGGGAQ